MGRIFVTHKCGCRTITTQDQDSNEYFDIAYCAMHSAAPDMLKAINQSLTDLRAMSEYFDEDDLVIEFVANIAYNLNKAYTKATGFSHTLGEVNDEMD